MRKSKQQGSYVNFTNNSKIFYLAKKMAGKNLVSDIDYGKLEKIIERADIKSPQLKAS